MTKIYNISRRKDIRRDLRNNMTKAEIYLWRELKNKKILMMRFLRQYGVGIYIVDFYCPKARLAVEVDGGTHITEEDIQYDKNRQSEIESLGIKFLRFTNDEIYNDLLNVLETIKNKLIKLTNPPAPPLFKGGKYSFVLCSKGRYSFFALLKGEEGFLIIF